MADDIPEKFTPKERRFIHHYLGDAAGNGAAAARLAGYAEANARFTARDLLTKPHIRAHIDSVLMSEGMSQAEVLHELTTLAKAPTEHFMQVTRPEERDETGEVSAPMIVRLDYSAKTKSLELIGKYHRMFVDNLNLSGAVGFGDLLNIAEADPATGEDATESRE